MEQIPNTHDGLVSSKEKIYIKINGQVMPIAHDNAVFPKESAAIVEKLVELEDRLKVLSAEHEKLKVGRAVDQSAQVIEPHSELSDLTEANRRLKAENADLRGDKRTAEERCAALQNELVAQKKKAYEAAVQYTKLERRYNDLSAEYSRLKTIVDKQQLVRQEENVRMRQKKEKRENRMSEAFSRTALVNEDICVGCCVCEGECPITAITMVDGKAVVNESACVQCGTCVDSCPVDAISL